MLTIGYKLGRDTDFQSVSRLCEYSRTYYTNVKRCEIRRDRWNGKGRSGTISCQVDGASGAVIAACHGTTSVGQLAHTRERVPELTSLNEVVSCLAQQ